MAFLFTFIKKHKWAFLAALVAVIGLFVFQALSSESGTDEDVTEKSVRSVELLSIQEFMSGDTEVRVVGTVVSLSEAVVRSETQGEVTAVYHDIGDRVTAGTIVAEVNNSSERAALLQAEARLNTAEAQLAIARGNSTNNETGLVNSIQNAYAVSEDAVRNKVDTFFVGQTADGDIKRLVDLIDDLSIRVEVNTERKAIEDVLTDWRASISTLTQESDTSEYFTEAVDNMRSIQGFLGRTAVAVELFEPNSTYTVSDIATFKSNLFAARTAVNTSLSSLLAAESALSTQASSGMETNQNVRIAEARVNEAEAGYVVAQNEFNKTQFRAPVAGEINELNVDVGNLISPFDTIFRVANNNALEIETYVSEANRQRISVGSEALVDGRLPAVVTRIAPALDSQTKKIRVVLALEEDAPLTNGASAQVAIAADSAVVSDISDIQVPLSALKIESNRTVVFTVDADDVLVAHPVQTGSILGDRVVIIEGVTADMSIVLDARGKKEGERVTILGS